MGEYADIKRKKVLCLLKKLSFIEGFTVQTGGNHQWMIKHTSWARPFPISFRNNIVNKVYIKDLETLVLKLGISKETFKEWLR